MVRNSPISRRKQGVPYREVPLYSFCSYVSTFRTSVILHNSSINIRDPRTECSVLVKFCYSYSYSYSYSYRILSYSKFLFIHYRPSLGLRRFQNFLKFRLQYSYFFSVSILSTTLIDLLSFLCIL